MHGKVKYLHSAAYKVNSLKPISTTMQGERQSLWQRSFFQSHSWEREKKKKSLAPILHKDLFMCLTSHMANGPANFNRATHGTQRGCYKGMLVWNKLGCDLKEQ